MNDEKGSHLQESYHFSMLQQLSDNMAIRFGCPIYLVGSFIEKPIHKTGDIDIVVPMDENRFKRLFGGVAFTDKQLIWRLKQKKYYEDCMPDVDIDLKPQLIDHFLAFKDERKIRLDQYDKHIKGYD